MNLDVRGSIPLSRTQRMFKHRPKLHVSFVPAIIDTEAPGLITMKAPTFRKFFSDQLAIPYDTIHPIAEPTLGMMKDMTINANSVVGTPRYLSRSTYPNRKARRKEAALERKEGHKR